MRYPLFIFLREIRSAFQNLIDPPLIYDLLQAELQRSARLRGIYTRVAVQLGVSVQHVKEVSMGRRNSPRVIRAMEREYQKILNRERAA